MAGKLPRNFFDAFRVAVSLKIYSEAVGGTMSQYLLKILFTIAVVILIGDYGSGWRRCPAHIYRRNRNIINQLTLCFLGLA